ncbi:CocE/NonD family hydrolase [Parabacteroides sp. OttesenSCG-928-G07]|nr:CocE/NonD family hydrolase [Parabacteroides sp. OttesenSCG-928-G21]MDL2277751.1 CocE/NonD family hydrolase [Parabacteroides sp. OttesenSCG-928-G07]
MKKTGFFICLFSLLLIIYLQGQKSSQTTANSELPLESYEYVYIDTIVKGGSGDNLVTRIYLPKGEGPWPVVITRTPYFREGQTTGDNVAQGQQYAQRGLGYIQQYCRGKGGSEGIYEPNIYEREDGLALVNWVADQSWCRSIGLFGASYMALTSWIIADSLPDKVKGIYLHHYGVDRHLSAYKDGLFRQDILTGWAIDNATEITTKPPRDRNEPYYNEARYMPQKEMDVDLLGAELPWYRDWITHTDYYDPYWQSGVWAQLRNIPSQIKVPMTIVAGLFDHHLEGTLKGYELLPPETKKNSRLILGSWNHSYQITPEEIHDTQHAKDIEVSTDQFEWLYRVVAQETIPRGEVQAYFVGADKWETFDTWPIPSQKEMTYFLTNTINAANAKAYTVSTNKPTSSAELKFIYDPQNPVMSVGGETLFNSSARRGSRQQPEIGYREDILFFLSEAVDKPLTISGPIKATIYMSSDCEDTSITYKVSEVMPDGAAYNIRSGITTLGYRNNRFGNRQLYTPGEIVALNIETLPVTWQIKPGNRLRIDITSSNFPEYSIHSNYAGVWSEQTQTRKANQTIYAGNEYPSHISIPTITRQ